MALSKKHKFVLYALYQYLTEANKLFAHQSLEMSVSKSVFIEALKKTKIADKSERALYRNLEILEKKKLIAYENKFLKPTERGLKMFADIQETVYPYLHAVDVIKKETLSMSKKAQTYFKQ